MAMAGESGYQLRILEGSRKGAYKLSCKNYGIGRVSGDPERDKGRILLDDPTVSREHAELVWNEAKKRFDLVHLSKTNQTNVEGRPIKFGKPYAIEIGDHFQLGLVVMMLERIPVASTGSSLAGEAMEIEKILAAPASAGTTPGAQPTSNTETQQVQPPRKKEDTRAVASQVLDILAKMEGKKP